MTISNTSNLLIFIFSPVLVWCSVPQLDHFWSQVNCRSARCISQIPYKVSSGFFPISKDRTVKYFSSALDSFQPCHFYFYPPSVQFPQHFLKGTLHTMLIYSKLLINFQRKSLRDIQKTWRTTPQDHFKKIIRQSDSSEATYKEMKGGWTFAQYCGLYNSFLCSLVLNITNDFKMKFSLISLHWPLSVIGLISWSVVKWLL